MQNTILDVNNLKKEFRPALSFSRLMAFDFTPPSPTLALAEISFSLENNRILAILGPNGAGKTTLLKIIATLILPDQGTLSVKGYALGREDEKIKSSVGLVIDEERSFYWRLTGRENLAFFAALYGFSKNESKRRIKELLEIFEVDYADRRFDSYSTGMKKRFAIMRALLHDPQVLLLDEPTKSLDFVAASHLRNFIKTILAQGQGKTIIFTTHQMDEALDFADTFMVLEKGRMRGIGTVEQLREQISAPHATLGEIFLALVQKQL